MTVYNLYIFDRNCTCLYYKEWVRHKEAGIPKDEEYKLMYGMIFSIKSLISRLSITSAKEGLVGYSASNYKLHYFETPTGFKFVMNTDTSVGNVQDILRHIYARIFVEYVIRNPLVLPGEPVESELFAANLDEYVQNLSFK
jgi:hypothetical protein